MSAGTSNTDDWIQAFIGQVVVVDLSDHHTIFGVLSAASPQHLEFTDADVHDQREANSSKEIYALETRDIGIRVNRKHCCVPRQQLSVISLLQEVADG